MFDDERHQSAATLTVLRHLTHDLGRVRASDLQGEDLATADAVLDGLQATVTRLRSDVTGRVEAGYGDGWSHDVFEVRRQVLARMQSRYAGLRAHNETDRLIASMPGPYTTERLDELLAAADERCAA